MSFIIDGIRSVAQNRSLGRKQRKGMQVTGLPTAKVTGEILAPASATVALKFQQQLATERRHDKLIILLILATTLLSSIALLLLILGII